jgi:oxygen-independent coproporphyrinogen-3 oxidase
MMMKMMILLVTAIAGAVESKIQMMMSGKNSPAEEISLYVHVPFCNRKCDYCHFYVLPNQERYKDILLKGLELEIERVKPNVNNQTCVSIYFGGGTPSLFGPNRVQQVLKLIKNTGIIFSPQIEVTLEANPDEFSPELAFEYAAAGINRLSIGVQSFNNQLLPLLSRQHSAEQAIKAVQYGIQAGISNISIDLMYDLPHQTLMQWQESLEIAASLPITHLSLYNLTIEPHTVFFKKQDLIRKQLPEEKVSTTMYQRAIEVFAAHGLQQYEISAFARNQHISKHNIGYWTGRNFWGLGPSAFSYWQGKRFRNVANLYRYQQSLAAGVSPIDFEEKLPPEESLKELLVIQLRLMEGVHLKKFQAKYGLLPSETQITIQKLIETDFLHYPSPLQLCLTTKGRLFYDSVASELI